jgi:hypothetical protein
MTIPGNFTQEDIQRELARRAASALWSRGNLTYKLDETQRKIKASLSSTKERKFFLLCSRRLGKSFTLVLEAFETALKKPLSRILYLAPTGKDAADIVTDIVDGHLLPDCPSALRPDYDKQQKFYTFKNGSTIRFRGVNGEHAESLRGGAADLVILDECGTMDDLAYVVSSVVMPMTLTTGGRILLATTPSRSPGHDSVAIYEDLAGRNATVKFTILDNPRVAPEVKAEFLIEAGEPRELVDEIVAGTKAPTTTTALREYFCEFVTDAASAVLPEFTLEAQEQLVRSSQRPPFFDAYVAMDPGFQDRTAILYGYWDFRRARLVIEDESLMHRPSTSDIASEIARKERSLWSNQEPYARVSDVDPRLIADLWQLHRIQFRASEKQDSLGAINLVRNMIQAREIEISPRCVHLIRQMKNAIWNNKATDFARAGSKSPDGHFDLVAALKYLCRGVNRHHNPYPEGYGTVITESTFTSPRHNGSKVGLGLMADTPFSRRLARGNRNKRHKWSF